MVPQPTRLTKPIPLRFPKAGRTIPVMTQLVGDLNEGVSGNLVVTTVTGDGTLQSGTPMTDPKGVIISDIACTEAGSFTINVSAG